MSHYTDVLCELSRKYHESKENEFRFSNKCFSSRDIISKLETKLYNKLGDRLLKDNKGRYEGKSARRYVEYNLMPIYWKLGNESMSCIDSIISMTDIVIDSSGSYKSGFSGSHKAACFIETSGGIAAKLAEIKPKAHLINKVYSTMNKALESGNINAAHAVEILYNSTTIVKKSGYKGLENFIDQASQIKKYAYIDTFVEEGINLIERLGNEGLKEVRKTVNKVSEKISDGCYKIAEILIIKSPDIVDRIGYDGLDKVAKISCKLNAIFWDVAAAFVSRSPKIIDKIGYDGLEKVGELAYNLDSDANNFIYKSTYIIDNLLKQGDQNLVLRVFDMAKKTAIIDSDSTYECLCGGDIEEIIKELSKLK